MDSIYAVGFVVIVMWAINFFWRKAAPKVDLPGPPGLPVFGNMFQLAKSYDRLHDWLLDNSKKYGKEQGLYAFRLPNFPSMIVPTDDKVVKYIVENTDSGAGIKLRDVSSLAAMSDGFKGSLVLLNGKAAAHRRKMYFYLFSLKTLREVMFPRIHRCAEKLIKRIEEHVENGEMFDIQDLFARATLDNITGSVLGQDIGSLNTPERVPFMESFDRIQTTTFSRVLNPLWKLKRMFRLGDEKHLDKDIKFVNDRIYQFISNYEAGKCEKGQRGILDVLEENSKKTGFKITKEFQRSMVWDFLVGGKDTTAVALSWLTYRMIKNPDIVEKVREEIKDKDLKNFSAVSVELPFLSACCLESLRMNPSLPITSRSTTNNLKLPNGVVIPEGSTIILSNYERGRNPASWGDDCLEFKPERFINGDKEHGLGKFSHFSGGSRSCIGKSLSQVQTKVLISQILQRFDLELDEGRLPITYEGSMTLWVKGGLWVKAKKRFA